MRTVIRPEATRRFSIAGDAARLTDGSGC